MKETATLVLSIKELKNILFEYYFYEDYEKDNNSKNKADLTIRFPKMEGNYNNAEFILSYKKKIESLSKFITKELILSQSDLNNIISEKISSEGYKVIGFDYQRDMFEREVEFIEFILKRQKIKIKKKGCR